jgi:hypothetical protein
LGPVRGDFQAAVIAKVIADVNSKKGRRNKFSNFLLKWGVGSGGNVEDESAGDPS